LCCHVKSQVCDRNPSFILTASKLGTPEPYFEVQTAVGCSLGCSHSPRTPLTSGLFSLAIMSCSGPNTLTNVVRSSTSTVSCFIARTVALLQMRKHFIRPKCNNACPRVGAGRANIPRLKHWKQKRRYRGIVRKLLKYI